MRCTILYRDSREIGFQKISENHALPAIDFPTIGPKPSRKHALGDPTITRPSHSARAGVRSSPGFRRRGRSFSRARLEQPIRFMLNSYNGPTIPSEDPAVVISPPSRVQFSFVFVRYENIDHVSYAFTFSFREIILLLYNDYICTRAGHGQSPSARLRINDE